MSTKYNLLGFDILKAARNADRFIQTFDVPSGKQQAIYNTYIGVAVGAHADNNDNRASLSLESNSLKGQMAGTALDGIIACLPKTPTHCESFGSCVAGFIAKSHLKAAETPPLHDLTADAIGLTAGSSAPVTALNA